MIVCVIVCVFVCVRERECVCERERECLCVFVCVVCAWLLSATQIHYADLV